MMYLKKLYIIIFLFFVGTIHISTNKAEDLNTVDIDLDEQYFFNQDLLSDFFKKLSNMIDKKNGKINIVHIGDSHIQAGFLTEPIKKSFQSSFGNGGLGFSFPYELVRTNGALDVRYMTNIAWTSWSNTRAVGDVQVGLGGYGLSTQSKDFVLQLSTENDEFNKIKLIYPTKKPQFRISISTEPLEVTSQVKALSKTHKIRKGESLSAISRKYGVSVAQIKKENRLKNNTIHPNKILKIPTRNTVKISNIKVSDNVMFAEMKNKPFYSVFASDVPLKRVTIFPEIDAFKYTINGFVLENKNPGIIYHTIGVNGAHISDYQKYPLFFDQLPILEPDLIIISLGTNESFAHMPVEEFMYQMDNFIAKLKDTNKNATILVTTPPPSMFKRMNENTYVRDYMDVLIHQKKYPVWDLYTHMDGAMGIKSGRFAPLMAKDKIHYTKNGYELQGYMFATDFINAFNNYREKSIK